VHQYQAIEQALPAVAKAKKSKKQKLEDELDAFTKEISELAGDIGVNASDISAMKHEIAVDVAPMPGEQPEKAKPSPVANTLESVPDMDADEREQISMLSRLEELKKGIRAVLEQKKPPQQRLNKGAQENASKKKSTLRGDADDELDFEQLNGWPSGRTKRK
jgi:hypothetical protein